MPEVNPGTSQTRVLVVDDSATIRQTIGLLLDGEPDMELVGIAASGQEAVRRAAELQPDIVLMDIHPHA